MGYGRRNYAHTNPKWASKHVGKVVFLLPVHGGCDNMGTDMQAPREPWMVNTPQCGESARNAKELEESWHLSWDIHALVTLVTLVGTSDPSIQPPVTSINQHQPADYTPAERQRSQVRHHHPAAPVAQDWFGGKPFGAIALE